MRKHRIYTVTANPALDLSGHVPKIIPNEKNYVRNSRLDPGGNGINAARIARRLGADPVLLGFIGGGAGEQLKGLLDKEGLSYRFTPIQGMTRTNVTVTNDEDHLQTRLTFPGPKIRNIEIRALFSAVRKLKAPGVIVLGGSAPSGHPSTFYPSLIRAAQSRGLGVMVDVPVPFLKGVFKARLKKLLFIKPNQTEFEGLTGKKFTNDLEIAREACRLLKSCEMICVSLADRGAILAWRGQAWFFKAPRVRARGTVGSGDSMVGAVAVALAKKGLTLAGQIAHTERESVLDSICWGIAAGAATATTEGTSLGDASLIRRLHSKCSVQLIYTEKSR
ncbi:MAG: hexose kinase [Oligoflexia bacterium]|nr:hexose kinase [Oligoflexia bacterium]